MRKFPHWRKQLRCQWNHTGRIFFVKFAEKKNLEDLLLNVGANGGGGVVAVVAPTAGGGGAAAPPPAEEKKVIHGLFVI